MNRSKHVKSIDTLTQTNLETFLVDYSHHLPPGETADVYVTVAEEMKTILVHRKNMPDHHRKALKKFLLTHVDQKFSLEGFLFYFEE